MEQSRRKGELDGGDPGVEAEIAALYQKDAGGVGGGAEEARSQVKSREEAAAARTAEIAVCENSREHNQRAQREIAAQLESPAQAGAESEQAIAALESLMQEKSCRSRCPASERGEALGRGGCISGRRDRHPAGDRPAARLGDAGVPGRLKAGAEKDASRFVVGGGPGR